MRFKKIIIHMNKKQNRMITSKTLQLKRILKKACISPFNVILMFHIRKIYSHKAISKANSNHNLSTIFLQKIFFFVIPYKVARAVQNLF